MLFATWNINGIKARLDNAVQWLKAASPEVCCLEEIKTEDAAFPKEVIEELGYNVAVHGQKGFNGVAILSKRPFSDVRIGLPGDPSDDQARYLEAVVPSDSGVVRVAAIYLPNGNPPLTEKYDNKLRWMDRLIAHARDLLVLEEPLVLAGDYNVIPQPLDAKYPGNWVNDALFLPRTRERYGALIGLGLVDALRATSVEGGIFTFWDYQAGAWQKDNGIRIDHILLSPQAADRLQATRIDKHLRAWERPSDHVPMIAELQL
jgi:exodeoxyribonuclease-3